MGMWATPGEGMGGSSSRAAAFSGTVVICVGDQAFTCQRSVLAAGSETSEYFARLLQPSGEFVERDAMEPSVPDADPAAFAYLQSYMYCMSMGLPRTSLECLAVPPDLRPTASLAGRLLRGWVVAALTEQLAVAATPSTVLADLVWADTHGLTELAARLRACALVHRREVELGELPEVVKGSPGQTVQLLAALFSA
ncbi:hypothetical protein HYH03_000396 [Edaphochlamys debaryana]|uniref:BTB domain-containing protein n=1 Tax=Edaphochlamys debaryana TaxID=47281 RepID=A0A836C761_9CHLO|nr:hypothetical protein HYH03_000396 [Edaphochlamys debaryana]|eukprot:KAG2501898.1 hypothetical protein HYH03_000396 [Edaphochlamys debaryana]